MKNDTKQFLFEIVLTAILPTIIIVLAVLLLAACGEKPCTRQGSLKATHGQIYYCTDHHDGNGLRWYKNG